MNAEKAACLVQRNNPIVYYVIPFFHREIFGTSTPCNTNQLMWLLGSETNMPHYEKVELPEHWISHIPIKRFVNFRSGLVCITKEMKEQYPWYDLAKSLRDEGWRTPAVAELYPNGDYVAIEGKHRVVAASLIEPYDDNYLIPCIVVVRNNFYSMKMFKQMHPNPISPEGYIRYPRC